MKRYVYTIGMPGGPPRYVGMSRNPWTRLQDHTRDRANEPLRAYLRTLRRYGVEPNLVILNTIEHHDRYVAEELAAEIEEIRIEDLVREGGVLFNRQGVPIAFQVADIESALLLASIELTALAPEIDLTWHKNRSAD